MRNPGKPSELELNRRLEVENEWEDLGEIQEVNSAGRIDQLNALRFKIQTKKRNFPREKSGEISGNVIPGMGGRNPERRNLQQIWGDSENRNRIYWETCDLRENAFSEIPDGDP